MEDIRICGEFVTVFLEINQVVPLMHLHSPNTLCSVLLSLFKLIS